MIVFDVCNKHERQCKSDEEIEKFISTSYILVIENQMHYYHHKGTGSDEMVMKSTQYSWHSISTLIRADFTRYIKKQQLTWSWSRIGLGLDDRTEVSYHQQNGQARHLPYDNNFQVAVTFEIDPMMQEFIRQDYTWFDWLASFGGVASLAYTIAQYVSYLDDPHMFVTSAMIAQEQEINTNATKVAMMNSVRNLEISEKVLASAQKTLKSVSQYNPGKI